MQKNLVCCFCRFFRTDQTFFQLYIPSMDDRLRALLNKSLVELYMSFGIGWDTDVSGRTAEQFPTISDLYGIIRRKVQQKDNSSVYYEELLTYLESATNGADHLLWNGYTTIRPRSGFIVLDTKSLIQMSGTVLAAQYFNVLSWCWEQITHDRNERIMLVADECWTMIDYDPQRSKQKGLAFDMRDFCRDEDTCRRDLVLRYFGEKPPDDGGGRRCDNCAVPIDGIVRAEDARPLTDDERRVLRQRRCVH